MKCRGCQAPLTTFNPMPLTILYDKSVLICPICNITMEIVFNKRQGRWKLQEDYDSRRESWKRGG